MSPGPRSTSLPSGILIHSAVWLPQTWAENWGVLCPFSWWAGSPFKTMWPGPRPTSVPSFVLIHPTVWPQYTDVTDRTERTDRQDRSPIVQGEPFCKQSPKTTHRRTTFCLTITGLASALHIASCRSRRRPTVKGGLTDSTDFFWASPFFWF